jgi:hypothetical protein
MKELMQKTMMGIASADERREFGVLWQERVKRILVDHADDTGLVIVTGS